MDILIFSSKPFLFSFFLIAHFSYLSANTDSISESMLINGASSSDSSEITIYEDITTTTNEDLFIEPEEVSGSFEIQTRKKNLSDFFITLLFVLMVINFFIWANFQNYTQSLWNSFFNHNLLTQTLREKQLIPLIPSLVILVTIVVVTGIASYLFLERSILSDELKLRLGLFGKILLLLNAYWIIKLSITYLLAWSSGNLKLFRALAFLRLCFYWLIGLMGIVALISFLASQAAQKIVLPMALLIAFLSSLYFVYRSHKCFSLVNGKISVLFFIYLCSFELMPVLMLVYYLRT